MFLNLSFINGVINKFIIHQTHYEKSDWSRAFNQYKIACELDMINAISAADIAFIMSSNLIPRSLVDEAEGEIWPIPSCIT